jgi:hypothetical protein
MVQLLFAIIIPLINGIVVAYLSHFITDDIGNRFIFAVLASRCVIHCSPAAMKIAVQNKSGIFLPMALYYLSFNITFGMLIPFHGPM